MASKLIFLLLLVYLKCVSCRGPELVVVPDSASVEYGGTIIMSCVAAAGFSGSQPTISWSRNGQVVSVSETENGGTINITSTVISTGEMSFVWSTLRICNLVADRTGLYSCTASNSQGNVTEEWSIAIVGEQAAELVVVPQTQLVEYHNTVVMVCVAYGFPIPMITFRKDGKALDNTTISGVTIFHKVKSIENGTNYTQSTLVLCNIREIDIGGYSCTADNGISLPDSETWNLNVNIPPRIVIAPDSQRVKYGSALFMVCTAYGYPLPSITFNNNGVTVQNSTETGISVIESNVTISGFTFAQAVLSICNITMNESGEYSCTADNDYGTRSQVWNIVLSHFPTPAALVLVPFENQNISEGNSLYMNCIAFGIPLPSVTWTRNGVELSSDYRVSSYDKTLDSRGHRFVHSILEICDLMEHDTGLYSCQALNTVGSQSFDWNITIDVTGSLVTSSSTPSTTPGNSTRADTTSTETSTTPAAVDFQFQTNRVLAIGSALGVFVTLTAVLLVLVVTYLLWSKWKRHRMGCWARRNTRTNPNGYIYAPPQTNNTLGLAEISLKALATRSIQDIPYDDPEQIYERIDTVGPYAQRSNHNIKYLASGSSVDSTEFAASFTTFTGTESPKKQEESSLVLENGGYVNLVGAVPTHDTLSKSNGSPGTPRATDGCCGTPSKGSVCSSSLPEADGVFNPKTDETNYSVITLEAMESCSVGNQSDNANTVITNEGAVLSVGDDDYEPMKPGVATL